MCCFLINTGFCPSVVILITLCGCFGGAPMAGTKHVCDDLANQNLIISNTEAPGEEVMVNHIMMLGKYLCLF